MQVIQVQAKVILESEEDLEIKEKYDLGTIAKDKEFVWRKMGFELSEIWRITEFDKTKCVITTYEDEKLLVKEPFDSLFARWEKMMQDEDEITLGRRKVIDSEEQEDGE